MSHTPGPWEVGGPYPGVSVIVCVDGGCGGDAPEPPLYEPICIVDSRKTGEQSAQALADARLIAAAPEMLEALKVAQDILNFRGEPNEIIDNAIAKAESETSQ